ncbi:MAG TPA: hypothetical protein VMF91_25855 [Bryobacteraceae bacterium]|nr:hypothetical protein [Bryobacteraceae bacterium]
MPYIYQYATTKHWTSRLDLSMLPLRAFCPIEMELGKSDGKMMRLSLSGSAQPGPAFERHFSIGDLVELWGLSEKTIRRIFADEPGVLEWGNDEQRYKRGYKTLRIPESVVERVHRRMRKVS